MNFGFRISDFGFQEPTVFAHGSGVANPQSTIRNPKSGFVLVAVLIVTLLASMVAAGLLYRMQAESAATAAMSQGEQAYAAALSGLQTALVVLTTPPQGAAPVADDAATTTPAASQPPPLYIADIEAWHDNPQIFRNRFVAYDGANRWYFTVYAQNFSDEKSVRYGLIDEAGKVNINSASREVLEKLPGMTSQFLDPLIDYRDPDAEPQPDGAEQEYYDRLPQPYLIKNGPLATVEELMLVKGFTAREVYGEDANLNGLLEPNEDDGDEVFPPDDSDGVLNPGLASYVTTISMGPDLDDEGKPKINLNTAGDAQLKELGLSDETVQFIRVYRNENGRFSHPSQLLEMQYTVKGQQGRGGRGRRGTQGEQAQPPQNQTGPQPGTVLRSGVEADDLPIIMAKLTTISDPARPQTGLINVNSAPPAVLAALPGLTESLAEQIAGARYDASREDRASTAWLYTQGLLDAGQYKAVAPLLTARGYQYRLRCVGFGVPCGRYRVIEAVIDTVGPSKIAYLRDITRLGMPLKLGESSEK